MLILFSTSLIKHEIVWIKKHLFGTQRVRKKYSDDFERMQSVSLILTKYVGIIHS